MIPSLFLAPVTIPKDRLLRGAWGLLAFMFFYYSLVGLHPFVEGDLSSRVDGSPLDRIFVELMAVLSLAVIWLRFRLMLLVAGRSWLVLALTGWCVASLLWSDYPDLTLRRALLLVLLTLSAFSMVLGMRSLRQLHTFFMFFMSFVMVLNIVGTVLFPAIAITDIGVRGLYTQKNVAGMVAMFALFVAVTWTFGACRRNEFAFGAGAVVLSAIFLVMTDSKTSIGLSALMLVPVPLLMVILRGGVAQRRWFLVVAALALALAVLLVFAANLTRDELLTLLFGDPTFTKRTDIWDFALREIARRPWTGAGYGAFWDVGVANDPVYRAPGGTFLTEVEPGVINQAHNGYLDLWLQVGLPAVAAASVVVIASIAQAIRLALSAETDRKEWGAVILFLLIMLIYAFNNFMEATLFSRGQFLNSMSTMIIFVLHRLVLDRQIRGGKPGRTLFRPAAQTGGNHA